MAKRQGIHVLNVPTKSEFIFPSNTDLSKPISNNTLLFAIYRMGFKGRHCSHGFRSTASSWLNEAGFNPDAVERQLSHGEPNKIRDAYNRADYMSERVKMMQSWADFLDVCADPQANVTHLNFRTTGHGGLST